MNSMVLSEAEERTVESIHDQGKFFSQNGDRSKSSSQTHEVSEESHHDTKDVSSTPHSPVGLRKRSRIPLEGDEGNSNSKNDFHSHFSNSAKQSVLPNVPMTLVNNSMYANEEVSSMTPKTSPEYGKTAYPPALSGIEVSHNIQGNHALSNVSQSTTNQRMSESVELSNFPKLSNGLSRSLNAAKAAHDGEIFEQPKNYFFSVNANSKKCNIGLKVLAVANVVFTVTVVAIICILPLETTSRNSLSSGMRVMASVASDLVEKSTTSNMSILQNAVGGVASGLMLNQFEQLRPWTAEDMPTIMRQLCSYFLSPRYTNSILYLHLSSPYSGFGAFCSTQYNNSTLVGKYIVNNESDYRYIVDKETLSYAEPRQPFYPVRRMTESEATIEYAFKENSFHNIAQEWSIDNANGISNGGKRWWVFSRFNQTMLTYTYPFMDYNGNLAVITGALRLDSLQTTLFDPGRLSLLGRSMVVELNSGIVLSSSWSRHPKTLHDALGCEANTLFDPREIYGVSWDWWNCTGNEDYNSMDSLHEITEFIDTVSDEYMHVAIEKLGGRGGIILRAGSYKQWQVSTRYKGTSMVVNVNRIDAMKNHLNMVVIELFIQSAITGSVEKTRNKVILSVAIAVFFIALIDLLLVYVFIKPLQGVSRGLSMIAQLRDGSDSIKCFSAIKEIAVMQHNFITLSEKLMYMKTFLPHGVMETQDDPKSVHNHQGTNEVGLRNDQTVEVFVPSPLESCSEPSGLLSSADQPGDISRRSSQLIKPDGLHLHLKESVLHDEINQFRRRYCSIVCVSMLIRESDYSIDLLVKEFMESTIPLAMRCGGVVEVQRPNLVMVTFGAHTKMAMNQTHAVNFALELMEVASSHVSDRIGAVIDVGENLVGTCGAANRNARVTYNVQFPSQTELMKILWNLKCRVLVTRPLAIALEENYLTIPVDAVVCGYTNKPLIIYELRGHAMALDSESLLETRGTIRVIRHAFASMLRGDYANALHLLRGIAGKDIQADRLLKMCRRFQRRGITRPYFRDAGRARISWEASESHVFHNSQGIANKEIGAFSLDDSRLPRNLKRSIMREGVESTTHLSPESLRKLTPLLDSLPEEPLAGGAECEQGLFEMFIESSDESDMNVTPRENLPESSVARTSRSNMKGDVPFIFTDDHGNTWTRSADKIGTGAFSVVYRGLSSAGDLVALKCLSLRSRNVDIQSAAEELKLFSQLRHENIVQYISCYVSNDYLIEVMELVPGGSLDTILSSFGSLPKMAVRCFLRDSLHGLMYLHSKNVVHCDVKPHNVLVAMDGVCKLSDFGSSLMRLSNSIHKINDVLEMRGTPGYMAPEVARGEVPTTKSDIYSIGVTVLELFTGRIPLGFAAEWESTSVETESGTERDGAKSPNWFSSTEVWSNVTPAESAIDAGFKRHKSSIDKLLQTPEKLLVGVGKGEVVPIVPPWLDEEVRDFVEACIASDPSMRPTASDLLNHPWML